MQKKHLFSLAFSRCINLSIIGLLFWIPLSEAGSATSVFKFSATFIGGSCEVTTSKSQIIFNGGEAISPSDIRLSPPEERFNLVLTNCNGYGLTPKITITGESTAIYGPELFRDSSSMTTSDGYGILLKTTGNNSFMANNNLAQEKNIFSKDWSTTNGLILIDATLPIVAQLTCGDCDYNFHKAGDLISTVTFNFIYE